MADCILDELLKQLIKVRGVSVRVSETAVLVVFGTRETRIAGLLICSKRPAIIQKSSLRTSASFSHADLVYMTGSPQANGPQANGG